MQGMLPGHPGESGGAVQDLVVAEREIGRGYVLPPLRMVRAGNLALSVTEMLVKSRNVILGKYSNLITEPCQKKAWHKGRYSDLQYFSSDSSRDTFFGIKGLPNWLNFYDAIYNGMLLETSLLVIRKSKRSCAKYEK